MSRIEIYKYLTKRGIQFEKNKYKAVFNMEELNSLELPYLE